VASGTVGFRSPRVKRRRISRRSFGSESSEEVKSRRDAGEPVIDDDAQESRIDWSVGVYDDQHNGKIWLRIHTGSGSMISSFPRHPTSLEALRMPNCSNSQSSAMFVRHHFGSESGRFLLR